jgi:hypothetical protein
MATTMEGCDILAADVVLSRLKHGFDPVGATTELAEN